MYAAYGQNTEAGIKRRRAERSAMDTEIVELRKQLRRCELVIHELSTRPYQRQNLSLADQIIVRLCRVFGFTKKELLGSRRQRELSFARHAAYYWIARLTALSLPQIGRKLHKDHTTILHGLRAYPAKRAAMGRHLKVLPGGKGRGQ